MDDVAIHFYISIVKKYGSEHHQVVDLALTLSCTATTVRHAGVQSS